MIKTWIVILLHQLIFQGMFVTKNISLHRKIGKKIRGHNFAEFITCILVDMWILAGALYGLEGRKIFVVYA